jgi:hypothetical protein
LVTPFSTMSRMPVLRPDPVVLIAGWVIDQLSEM